VRDWAIPTALLSSDVEAAGDRLALAIVAGHWNVATQTAYPGSRRVAELSACAPSTASRRLARLVARGDLVVASRGAGTRATRYRVPSLESGPVVIPSERNANGASDPSRTERNGGSAPSESASAPSGPSSAPFALRHDAPEVRRIEEDLRARAREERDPALPETDADASAYREAASLGIPNPVTAIRRRLVAPPLRREPA